VIGDLPIKAIGNLRGARACCPAWRGQRKS